ncbi:uncharacterized protein [Montipora capricornis]|uniref:uncharacterized protein n=1 Tax=Montipora capricornis TaxID=246305 RepID=UPI0035F13DCF
MATGSSSKMETLSQLTVDQIREMLGKKGLSTTGNLAEASKEPLQVKSEVEIQELRIEMLTVYRENYLQLRNELIALVAEDVIEEELRRWGKILSEVDKAMDAAHEFLNKDCDAMRLGDHSSKDIAYIASRISSNLKLPRIELPKYNGNVLKFQNVWDQFEAAVHDNVDLPNVQKFTYLRSVLTGNALKAIDGFEANGANYEATVENI